MTARTPLADRVFWLVIAAATVVLMFAAGPAATALFLFMVLALAGIAIGVTR